MYPLKHMQSNYICLYREMLLLLLFWCIALVLGNHIPTRPKFSCPNENAYIYPCVCIRGSDEGLYVKCENTNLATLSVAFLNLGKERLLIEELTIYKCNIGMF
jgi:hypothetical protein